jgi:hypothetical protein
MGVGKFFNVKRGKKIWKRGVDMTQIKEMIKEYGRKE